MKNYYELLGITGTAAADEIKHAFRHVIARYHPDKVQHLGTEFQAMAAERAAGLTEAYRILSDTARRTEYDELAVVPKAKLFARAREPRLLVRFVPVVDPDAVAEAWTAAARWPGAGQDEICVILMGSAVAPARDLAHAIGEQRGRRHAAKATLIPVDARDWQAHVPTDAPQLARTLLERLQKHR